MSAKLRLSELNSLSVEAFESIFENVVECWPNAAISVAQRMPFVNFHAFIHAFNEYLTELDIHSKENILQAHPDLAGKLANEGKLTKESTTEQAIAGLNNLTTDQLTTLQALNQQYKEKFNFPFVICVRQTNKIEAIIEGLTQRLDNTRDTELFTGIEEVKKICQLRICQLIDI